MDAHQSGRATGYEPVYYSAGNGQPTLRVTDVAKPEVSQVQVEVKNVEVKLEHVGQRVKMEHVRRGSDEFQYMSHLFNTILLTEDRSAVDLLIARSPARKPKSRLHCLH